MLDKAQAANAARTLQAHRNLGTKILALPEAERPQDRADGYAIQALIEAQSARPLFGWKIAATSEAGQKHINVAGPMAGRILAETLIADGGATSLAGNAMRVAEPEFAFRMKTDLPPRAHAYGIQDTLDAVESLHPAIEVPDSRYSDFVAVGAAQIIADNACAHQFVLGPAATCDWRSRDLIEEKPVIALPGERYIGHGRNVLGDPRVALAWLANELSGLGLTLRAGEIVTTGTCHTPLPIAPATVSMPISASWGACRLVSANARRRSRCRSGHA